MPSDRKFYRTVIQVEILSEYPYGEDSDLSQVAFDITEGDCSGQVTDVVRNEECDGKRMAELLQKQNSDPSFFMLDESGNDMEE